VCESLGVWDGAGVAGMDWDDGWVIGIYPVQCIMKTYSFHAAV
jgi:hypothetical protein